MAKEYRPYQDAIDDFDGDYGFLSNFAVSHVYFEGTIVPTVEHAYQAAKTLDPVERRAILHAGSPGEAKALGRKATLRPDWEEVKDGVMALLLWQKFGAPKLAKKLLATGDRQLIEGNWWHDQVWGDCRCGRRPACERPGENRLGKLLMEIRAQLRRAPVAATEPQEARSWSPREMSPEDPVQGP